jgi:putative membrane protein
MSDPRVFFAAERTLLAWVRSGLTVMALGFVVARFGLFLTLLAASSGAAGSRHTHWISSTLGITLVALGAVSILAAQQNHRAYLRQLPPEDVPGLPIPWLTSFLATAVAMVGLTLAVYLAVA